MKKFKMTKRFSLDFLGKEWKDAYIDFERVSIGEMVTTLPEFQAENPEDVNNVLKGIKGVVDFLKKKFVSGKGVTEAGLVDLEVGDLENLPAEVLSKAIGFLSQGIAPEPQKP